MDQILASRDQDHRRDPDEHRSSNEHRSSDEHRDPDGVGAEEGVDALDGGPGAVIAPSLALNRLWRLFTSKRFGMLLILTLGLLSLIGAVVAQAPTGLRSDPAGHAQWLESVRPKYGGWTAVLDTLGLFAVFTSLWFKTVTVLLAVSILACSVNRAPKLWRQAHHPHTRMGNAFFAHAALRDSGDVAASPEEVISAARTVLHRHRFRVITDPDAAPGHLYADRYRFGPFGTVLAHVSFVLILIGAAVSASAGFKESQFAVTVGSRVEVGHGTGLAVAASSFTDAYYPDGSPKDYASDLVVYRDGQQVAAGTVRVNQPLRVGGVRFYQSYFGTAAAMRVTAGSGAVLFDGGVPLQWSSQDGRHSIGQLALPEQRLTVYVVAPASGEVDPTVQPGQVQLELYPDGAQSPTRTLVVSQQQPTSVSGVEITFLRERQFTGLIVARDPGALLVWIGSALMIVGLFAVFFFPHRRIWLRARDTGTGDTTVDVASALRRDSAFESQFHRLVEQIQHRAATHPTRRGPQEPERAEQPRAAAGAEPQKPDPQQQDPQKQDPQKQEGRVI